MKNKMITLVALAATLVSSPVLAHHHHHHGAAAFGIGAAVGAAVGLVGGALAAPAYSQTTVVATPAVVAPAPAAVYAPAPVYTTPVVTQPVVYQTAPVYAPAPIVVGPTHPIRVCNPYGGGWRWRGGNCHEYRPPYHPSHWRVSSHGNPYYNPPVYRNGQWRR